VTRATVHGWLRRHADQGIARAGRQELQSLFVRGRVAFGHALPTRAREAAGPRVANRLDARPSVRDVRQALRATREQRLGPRTAHRPLSETPGSSSRRQASTRPCPPGHAGTPQIRTNRQAGRIHRRSGRLQASRDWPEPTRTDPNALTLESGYA